MMDKGICKVWHMVGTKEFVLWRNSFRLISIMGDRKYTHITWNPKVVLKFISHWKRECKIYGFELEINNKNYQYVEDMDLIDDL